MDHFNSTVHNGALVSTRRGLQVSKTKHHGTRFVNAVAAPGQKTKERRDELTNVDLSKPLERRFKFVSKPREPRKAATKVRGKAGVLLLKDEEDQKPARRREMWRQDSASSTSSSDSVDQALLLAEDFNGLPGVTKWNAKPWRTHGWGWNMPENGQRLVHLYFNVVPKKMYPYEELLYYNPARTASFFERTNCNLVTMHCVVMTAILIETLLSGEPCSDDLLSYISKVCAMVNGKIEESNGKIDTSTIECIVAMAVCGSFIGRHDHWHLHMSGLKSIIEINGGLQKEWGYLLNKIRRGDVKGAAVIGALPYLEYVRFHEPVTDTLPLPLRRQLTEVLKSVLSPCSIQACVVESVTSLVLFAHTVKTALASGKSRIRFDPASFIEEWYYVEHQLIRYPGALRDEKRPLPRTILTRVGDPPMAMTSFVNADRLLRHSPPKNAVPAPADNVLEPALRTASVLYIETMIPDDPRSVNSYAVLVTLLSKSVRTILDLLLERQANVGLGLAVDSDTHTDGLPSFEALKPVMIWVCLVGYIVAKIGDGEIQLTGDQNDRSSYTGCLALIVGPSPEYVDRLTDADLVMFRLLEMKGLHIRNSDERHLLRMMLMEHILGETDAAL